MFMSFLLDIVYAVIYNLILIVFGLIAVSKPKKGKKSKGWLIAGAIIQGVSVFGTVTGMIRDPSLWATTTNIFAAIGYVLLVIIFALLIRKKKTV